MRSKVVFRTIFTPAMISASLLLGCTEKQTDDEWVSENYNQNDNTNQPSSSQCYPCVYHHGYWWGSPGSPGYYPPNIIRGGIGGTHGGSGS